jgi:hypothetical protein
VLNTPVGDLVERGQVLGLVGNSGNTAQPHLHMHFTDAWTASPTPLESLYFSQGLPARFWVQMFSATGASSR